MAMSQTAKLNGEAVEILDTEQHRDRTMHYVKSESKEGWAFEADIDGI